MSFSCIKFSNHHSSDNEIIQATSQFDSTYSMRFRKAYYQGIQEAHEEIKKSQMTIYVAGLIPPQSDTIDRETELTMKIVGGCLINDSLDGLILGHNNTIKKHLISDEIRDATTHLEADVSVVYRKAYFQGMQEGYKEIKNNKITRYVYGKADWGEFDKETGIPIKVIAGCIVPDSIMGRADGHNYIILKYLNHEIK